MTCDETLEHLDDWLDGRLPSPVRAEIELHLAGCAECRDIASDARALRPHLARLQDRPPPTDLWRGIEGRITRPRRFPSWWAAAAVALVVGSTGIAAAALWSPPPTTPPLVATSNPVEPRLAELERATASLSAAVRENRDDLDPETRAVVERNLEIIDQAIAETRAALEGSPADPRVQQALVLAYEQKQRLLAQVLHAPGKG